MLRAAPLGLLLLLLPVGVGAQPLPAPGEGRPAGSRAWSWRDYDAHNQNWGVDQSEDGIVYVANSEGLLEFDGESWRLHSFPLGVQPTVRSLAVTPGDRVYVGGIGEIGVWAPDSIGQLRFTSLVPRLPEADRAFGDVWSTQAVPGGVVFQTERRLFLWDGREMRVWASETKFRPLFRVGEALYLQEEGVGLRELRGGRLSTVRGGAAFADRRIDVVLPHPEGVVVAVRGEGLELVRRGVVRALEGTGSAFLQAHRAYTAIPIPDRYAGADSLYAVATVGAGVALVTRGGRLVRVYRDDVGLGEADTPVGLHHDAQGGLWVAHLQGILRINVFAPTTRLGAEDGLEGSVYATEVHDGAVYVGTNSGLFRLREGRLGRPGEGGPAYSRFERAGPAMGQTWALLSTDAGLLVASGTGVYAVQGGRSYAVTEAEAFSLLPVAGRGRVLVGQADGVAMLDLRDGRWVASGRVEGVDRGVRALVTDPSGGVWAAQSGEALFHLDDLTAAAPRVQRLDVTTGLDRTPGLLLRVRDEVWMYSREGVGVITWDGSRVHVRPVPELNGVAGVYGLYAVGESVWIGRSGLLRALRRGRFRDQGPFQLRNAKVISVDADEWGVVWIGTSDGLLRYDPRVLPGEERHPAWVRLVTDRERRPLFGGAGAGASGGHLVIPPELRREVRFEVAAAFFDGPGTIEYQYRLEGFEDEWGAWSGERVANFTNLWPGSYELRVRARDASGTVSEEAAFPFEVVPPWYLTWWAYVLYVAGGGGLMWGLSTWRLREHHRRLDEQRARSARLQRLSSRLEKTNARLRQADKLKDDLLANTSHELRTPLTAILGFSEMLLAEAPAEVEDLALGIHRGGDRLLKTVNGLLDMFKLQSGTMPVNVVRLDAAAAVRQSVALLQPLAQARETDLRVFPETLAVDAALDPDLLDRVVTNVVSNAIKFTERGRVTVLVDGDETSVRVTVRDTGVGIPEADLERILEPFEQVSTGFARTHEGTGLGLSIVQRVLDLVGGHVSFQSEEGVGTTVHVTVPREWDGATEASVALGGVHPILEGAYVLCVGLDRQASGAVEAAVGRFGTVCDAPTLARALREARTSVYDVVLVAASDAETERRQVRAIREVPGYPSVTVLRVGGDALTGGALEERGFSGHLQDPSDLQELVEVFEAALARVEAAGGVLV